MTLSEIRGDVFRRLGVPSDGSGYYTAAEVTAAINRALSLFSTISLSSVRTQDFSVSPAALLINPVATDPMFLLPLNAYCSGEMSMGTLRDVQARDPRFWTARPADPEVFVPLAPTAILLYPAPALGTTISIRYARVAPTLSSASDVPDVPAEFHAALADGAAVLCRAKVGYQGDTRSRIEWGRFMEAAQRALQGLAERIGQRSMKAKEVEAVLQSMARISI